MNWKPSVLTFVLLTAICVFAPVAFGADPVPDVTIIGGASTSGIVPWLGGAGAVLSTFLLVIREGRGFAVAVLAQLQTLIMAVLEKVHEIAKDCQPTIRVLHVYEDRPRADPTDTDNDT